SRRLLITPIIARHDDERPAQMPRIGQPHPGVNAPPPRFIAATGHDASTDRHRLAAQRTVVSLLQRGEKRIGVEMQDSGHGEGVNRAARSWRSDGRTTSILTYSMK